MLLNVSFLLKSNTYGSRKLRASLRVSGSSPTWLAGDLSDPRGDGKLSLHHLRPNKIVFADTGSIEAMYRLKTYLTFPRTFACSCRTFHHTSPKQYPDHKTHFEHAGPLVSLLKSRSVIRFQGPDTLKFLQGLLTNDVRRFGEPVGEKISNLPTPNVPVASASPVYAALLTPQGRFLYDLFLYKPPRSETKLDKTGTGSGADIGEPFNLLADVDTSVLDELLETLNKYRLRSKVEIDNVTEDFSCWQRYGPSLSEKLPDADEPEAASVGWGAGVDRSATSASRGSNFGWQWFKDPRLDCLGFRGIFPSNETPPLVEIDKETDEANYLLWRIKEGVAEGSTEIQKGEAVPLEYNLVGLNAISFDKGCYVGQELIARSHHRGVIRKRMVPVRFVTNDGKEVEDKVAPGSEIIDTTSAKKAGFVNNALGCFGLGLLRMEAAFRGSGTLSVEGQDNVKVEAVRPKWWPSEWLENHQHHTASA